MKREEQIKAVCSMLSMSEKFDGEKIGFFVDEVKQYMLAAGVPLLLVNDRRAIGYDLVFGPATKQEIEKIQKRTFEKRMEGLL